MKENYEIYKYNKNKNPFLSIITRRMKGKRSELFVKHVDSVKTLSLDYEEILIVDPAGYGMLEANKSFQYVADEIEGEYVYLLDDDDFIVNKNFIQILKELGNRADVIFFKMKILTGDGDQIYPKPQSWKTRQPKRGQIGGSCFVVKKWVYQKYITNFAHPSFGDWNFITEVLKDSKVKTEWINVMMAETGKVSRGK